LHAENKGHCATEIVIMLGKYFYYKWEDNIKMDFQEVGCEDMDWIKLSQDRDRWRALVNTVLNLHVP
jgi:hypothetical protein